MKPTLTSGKRASQRFPSLSGPHVHTSTTIGCMRPHPRHVCVPDETVSSPRPTNRDKIDTYTSIRFYATLKNVI